MSTRTSGALVVAISLALSSAAAIADPPASERPGITTPKRLIQHLGRLCRLARDGDTKALARLVRVPLRGHAFVNPNDGDPLMATRRLDEVSDIADLPACKSLPTEAEVRTFRVDGDVVVVVVESRRSKHRFDDQYTFDADTGALIGTTAVLQRRTKRSRPRGKPRPYELSGRVDVERGVAGRVFERALMRELERRPGCLRDHAARRRAVSATLVIDVDRAGGPATTTVRASTVAPTSLLNCLREQVAKRVVRKLSGKTVRLEYVLWVAIPVQESELPPNMPTIDRISSGRDE